MIKILFDKTVLTNAVLPALCAVSERNTVTAMEGVYFETQGTDRCVLCTYDMEKGVHEEIDARVEMGGSFIINANKLSRIIRMMPEDTITIEVDDKNLCQISSGNSTFKMHSLPGTDFPSLPVLKGNNTFSIAKSLLKKMIAEVQFAIGQNDPRAVFNGACFEVKQDQLKIVACDGNRLAVRECACEMHEAVAESGIFDLRFIVPGKTLNELSKLIGDEDEEITIATTRRHIIFFLEKMTFFSRLIDSEYIDYNRVIRKESKITVYLSRAAFISSLERAALVTEERAMGQSKPSVKCSFEEGVLHVYADNLSGSVHDEIPIEKEGEDLLIGFNCRYLLDALRACPEDSLKVTLASSLMSMQIEGMDPEKSDRYLYMVLPVKLS